MFVSVVVWILRTISCLLRLCRDTGRFGLHLVVFGRIRNGTSVTLAVACCTTYPRISTLGVLIFGRGLTFCHLFPVRFVCCLLLRSTSDRNGCCNGSTRSEREVRRERRLRCWFIEYVYCLLRVMFPRRMCVQIAVYCVHICFDDQ